MTVKPPASCPLCHSTPGPTIHVEQGYPLSACPQCGLIYVTQRPTSQELNIHYQHYLPVSHNAILAWRRMMMPVCRTAGRLINKYAPAQPRRLLDVGCGYGFFLQHMAKQGWHTTGVEISNTALYYARQHLKMNVLAGPLEQHQLTPASYGVITAFYLIEHLPDPRNWLQHVKRLLAPGGLLLLRWPHTTPLVRLSYPYCGDLRLYDVPSHLQDFNPRVMANFLRQAGLCDIRTLIGGFTLPASLAARCISVCSGLLAELLWHLSSRTWLLPGVSKTTLAKQPKTC